MKGKMQVKIVKRLLAYVLVGAMVVSNMTSSNLTAFASTPTNEEEYNVETSSAEIEETSDEEEKAVEENNKVEGSSETPAPSDPVESTPTPSDPVESTPTPSDPVESTPTPSSSDEESSVSTPSSSDEGSSTESSSSEESSADQGSSEEETPDTDGFYDGFKASSAVEGRSYYYNFATTFDGAYADKKIPNQLEKGLFSFNAGNTSGAVYHSTQHGVEFKTGNHLTFKVSGDSFIVVGGNNNSNCADLAATSSNSSAKLNPTTNNTKTAEQADLAACKAKGDNALVYEYTGSAGDVTLTLNLSGDQTSTKAYIAYVCVIPMTAADKPDADGFYDGFAAPGAVEGRSYYYNFATTFDGAYADKKIPNQLEKGLFSFDAGNTSGAVYHSTQHGIEFKTGNKLTFKVSGNSYIVVGGNNNSNCEDLAATSTSGTLSPRTLSTKTAAQADLAACKTKGANTLVYEYTGAAGDVTLTLNLSGDQTSTKAYIAYVCVMPVPKDQGPCVKGKNVDGKPDVWDFAAGAIELDDEGMPTKYINEVKDVNNMLTEDIMNSWYGDDVAAGTVGPNLSSFAVKDEEGNVLLEFSGNGKTNHRIRSTSNKITKCDVSTKKVLVGQDENGENVYEEYLGYVYSNSASEPNVYLGMMLDEGDIVTAVVSSNGGASLLKFESMDDKDIPAQSYEYKPVDGPNAAITTFYAPKAGKYKLYSANEKLVVARLTVEQTDYVTVSGTVTAPETLTKDYGIMFTNRESGAVKTAPVKNGAYTIDLNEKYTYDVSLADANGFVVDNEERFFKLEGDAVKVENGKKSFTYDVKIKAVDLVTVTGNIKGLTDDVAGRPAKQLENLNLTFESDKIYIPELTVNTATGAFTLVLEKGVEYAVKADGVDDFELKTTTISATEAKTADIEFAAKPVYDVTIEPVGATKEVLADATLTFARVYAEDSVKMYEEDYVYTFTGTEGIKLRDGQYEVKVKAAYPYKQQVTPDLKVEGKNVTCTVKFSSKERTKWDFKTDPTLVGAEYGVNIQGTTGTYEGLEVDATTGKLNSQARKDDAQFNSNTKISVPVTGPCTVVVNVYANTYTVNGIAATEKITTVEIKEAGKVEIVATANTYLNSIEVIYPSEVAYKSTITVGAKDCDYTTINDALAAVREMDRTDENGNTKRVTIVIQPGDYEEMLVIDTPNVTLKNANENPSITPVNKGVNIDKSSVRITSYYGHGYAYYSMGSDCKWNADILAANKANGCLSFENPGTGTTSGSYWNATVVINTNGFEADGIIFENSFNQYVSKKAAEDVIVPLAGAKGENLGARNEMKVGSTAVQYKDYVERAAALALYNNCKQISFNNCSFIGRQDTLYGGVGTTAAFYGCDIYGGTDYIFGGMTAVFAKCGLLFNTNDQTIKGQKDDIGHITAPQQSSGRGYLLYNCTVTTTTPGVNTASKGHVNPGTFGRPWAAVTGEALFYKAIVGKTKDADGKVVSLIQPEGWNSGLSGESVLSQEYGTIELSGVDNSANRVSWATVLKADADGNVTLADGNTTVNDSNVVAAFLGDWNPFAGKDMTISGVSNRVDPVNPPSNENVAEDDDKLKADETNKADTVNFKDDTDKYEVKAANLAAKGKKPLYKVTVTYKHTYKVTEGEKEVEKTVYQELTEGVHYVVAKYNNSDLVTAKKQWIVVKGTETLTDLGTFVGTSAPVSYMLFDTKANTNCKDIAKIKPALALANADKAKDYTGAYVTAAVENLPGTEHVDYELVYKNNVNAGTASVTVLGKGDTYYGSKTFTYKINPVNLSKVAVTLDSDNLKIEADSAKKGKYIVSAKTEDALTYTGDKIVFDNLSITAGGVKLKEGLDYTITYKNNAKVGKASATIKATNNFSGSIKLDYTIVRDELGPNDLTNLTADAQYTAKKGPQVLEIKTASGVTLKAGVDFKVNYNADTKLKDDIKANAKAKTGSAISIGSTYTDVEIEGIGAYKPSAKNSNNIPKGTKLTIKVVKGDFQIKSGTIVDTVAFDKADKDSKNRIQKLIAATKITDAGGTKPTANEIANITAKDNTVTVTLTEAAKAYYNETEISCRVATKLSNVVKQKAAKECPKKWFDGVNKITLTDKEILDNYLMPKAKGVAELPNDLRIVVSSYKNNHKVGSATVTIEAVNESPYYGTMNVKVDIVTEKKPKLAETNVEGPSEEESSSGESSSSTESSDVENSSSTESSKAEESSSSTESSKTEESSATTESSKTEESSATTESSKTEESSATTESSKTEESSATTESSKTEESSATTESSKTEESSSDTESSETEESSSDTESSSSDESSSDTESSSATNTDNASQARNTTSRMTFGQWFRNLFSFH